MLLVILFSVAAGQGAAAGASRDDVQRRQAEVDAQRQQSAAELAEISDGLAAAAARLADLQARVPAAREAVATAEAAADTARARDAELATELQVAAAQITVTTGELRARQAETDRTEAEVTSVVRETYAGTNLNTLAMLIEAGDPQEYADMLLMSQTVRRSQNDSLALLAVQQADLRNTEAQLEAQRDRLDALKREAEQQVATTAAAEQAAVDAQAALAALVSEQQASVAGYEAAKQAEENRQAQLQATSDALARRLAEIAAEEARAAAAEQARRAAATAPRATAPRATAPRATAPRATTPRAVPPAPESRGGSPGGGSSGGYLSYPVDARVSSSFGYRFHPILQIQRLHTGTDFAAACGSPVRAAADGEIVAAGWAGGYGNQVVIAHGRVDGVSLATSYSHLTSFVVTSGEVSRGQLIAYSGTTGLSTGCHLHFETRESGTPVDPMTWLG